MKIFKNLDTELLELLEYSHENPDIWEFFELLLKLIKIIIIQFFCLRTHSNHPA